MFNVDLYPELPVDSEPGSIMEVDFNFRAMNTMIDVVIYTADIPAATQACYAIEEMFNETESLLSRFRPTSELSKLNRQGFIENPSQLLMDNVQAAYQMADLTQGVFDPTILNALEAAGYDRSYELLADSAGQPRLFNQPRVLFQQGWQNMIIDRTKRTIRLPFEIRVDLGGIAKGSTVDRATRLLRQAGFENFLISAGGDMFLGGCPPRDEGWQVGIEKPMDLTSPQTVATLKVSDRAVATSSTMGRRWQNRDKVQHHLIDPRTGQPVANGIASVTAQANSVQLADVMAKTALILGPEAAKKKLKSIGGVYSFIFVTQEGAVIEL